MYNITKLVEYVFMQLECLWYIFHLINPNILQLKEYYAIL